MASFIAYAIIIFEYGPWKEGEADMPLYDFRCRSCGEVSEMFLRDLNVSGVTCPACGGEDVEKLLSSFNTPRSYQRPHGLTCCGREERCDKPSCEESCH